MENTSRPYRYRRNPVMRALVEAAEDRAVSRMLDLLNVRDRLPGWHMRRLMLATQTRGL